MEDRLLEITRLLLETPTAPFCEQWMLQQLDSLLATMPGVDVRVDKWGNRLATVGAMNAPGALIFVSHLDHPGFLPEGECSGRELQMLFEGRVFDEFFAGAPVRLYRDAKDRGVAARVREFSERRERQNNRVVLLEAAEPIVDPVLGMWDVEPFAVRDRVIHGRACDDLCGTAAILVALEQWGRAAAEGSLERPVGALFTRAEEAGFCGALACVTDEESRAALPSDALYISVEISKAGPMAPLGGGAVLRLGDKAGLFDARGFQDLSRALDFSLNGAATRPLRKALMDGGTCEATAFSAMGLRAAGMCAPVVNYHNMDESAGRIAPEQVSLDDLCDLAAAIHTAGIAPYISPPETALRATLERLAATGRARLAPQPQPIPCDANKE